MKGLKPYLIIGTIALVIGLISGLFINKPKAPIEHIVNKIVYRDTCIESTLLCTITTQDSFNIYYTIRKGLKSKTEVSVPEIIKEEAVGTTDTIVLFPPGKRLTYYKKLDTGLIEVWDTVTVVGKIEEWKRAHKLDTLELIKEKLTYVTAVVEQGEDNSGIIKYIPYESRNTYLGASAGVLWAGKPVYHVGVNVSGERLGATLFTNPKDLTNWGIRVNFNLFKLNKK